MSITSPHTAVHSPAGVRPVVKRIPILEPSAGEDRAAHEIRQPANAPEVSSCRNVVVSSPDLAGVVGAEPEQRTE